MFQVVSVSITATSKDGKESYKYQVDGYNDELPENEREQHVKGEFNDYDDFVIDYNDKVKQLFSALHTQLLTID